jgi:hypothetical protein
MMSPFLEIPVLGLFRGFFAFSHDLGKIGYGGEIIQQRL